MGIDPITHKPLQKEETENSKSHVSENFPEVIKTDEVKPPNPNPNTNPQTASQEENSHSPTDQNSSSDEFNCCSLYENDPLISCLFTDDIPDDQIQVPWEFPSTNFHDLDSFWDDNCSWLLDCQDFGVHDFGFESSGKLEPGILSPLDMGNI